MVALILLVLCGAVLYLWKRTSDQQRQIDWLKGALDPPTERPAASEAKAPVRAIAAERKIEPVEEAAAQRAARRETPTPEPQSVSGEAVPEFKAAEPREKFSLPRLSIDFEDLFGRRLPIWAGGIALAVAGFFLVRYSIEAGLITPSVRVILGFAFGLALIGAAEAAFRFEGAVKDERVRQALAGAGLATLYASFYLAGSVYGLLGSTLSFLGLASVTAAAIALSFRFGLPCAVLGLVGGFAAPTLVGSEDANLPMLALYLALITAGLALTGKRQDRAWLGLASLGGALGWGLLMLTSGFAEVGDTLAVGGFLLLVGAAMPLLLTHESLRGFGRLAVAGLATLQMAALVDQASYTFLAWSLYALLAAGIGALGLQYPRMREGSAVAAATGLWLLAIWPDPAVGAFAAAGTAFTAIFAGLPLLHLMRGQHRAVDIWQLSGFPVGLIGVATWHFAADFDAPQAGLAGAAALLAAFPSIAAWKLWPKGAEPLHTGGSIALTAAAIAVFAAGLFATPIWAAPLVGGAIACIIGALRWKHADVALSNIGWGAAWVTLIACLVTMEDGAQLLRAIGDAETAEPLQNILRWAAAAVPFGLLSMSEPRKLLRPTAEVLAALLVYIAAAQVIPAEYLAWMTMVAAFLAAWRLPARLAAQLTLLSITALWALWPVAYWLEGGFRALYGVPLLAAEVPAVSTVLRRVVPALVAGSALVWFTPISSAAARRLLGGLVASLGVIIAHVLFKQLFALQSLDRFREFGLVERTAWEALLIAMGYGLWRLGVHRQAEVLTLAGRVAAAAAFSHFTYFTVLLHNPLWAEQWIGSVPLLNWLLPSYAAGGTALFLLRRMTGSPSALAGHVTDAIAMGLIFLLALSELRNIFAGGWLTSVSVSQTEDLLRSLLGIVLAIAFLLWGARIEARSWRIGSLVLMLGAVLKVFWFDTAALEGLTRIASIMALGFSLIGIGWFYSRQLSRSPRRTDETG